MCPGDSVDSRGFQKSSILFRNHRSFPELIDIFAETIDIFAELTNILQNSSIFWAMFRWFSHVEYDEQYMPELFLTLLEPQNSKND